MNKKKVIILIVCTVLLFIAAFFGYNSLSENYAPETQDLSDTSDEEQPQEEASSSETEVIIAPDFTVYDAEGNAVSLSDFSGKPVVINFWATWCGYCVREMPAFERLSAEYADEVVFMMINVTDGQQEKKEDALSFIEKNGYTFPVYYDTDLSATISYGAWSLPATGFITESGVFVGGQTGAMSEGTLRNYIEQLLFRF